MLEVYNIVNQNFYILYSIYSYYKILCGAVIASATNGHCCPTWTTHTPDPQVTSASLDALFPGPGCPGPSARLWCGLSRPGVRSQRGLWRGGCC